VFNQLMSVDDFLTFKRMMVKRNRELEAEALKQMLRLGNQFTTPVQGTLIAASSTAAPAHVATTTASATATHTFAPAAAPSSPSSAGTGGSATRGTATATKTAAEIEEEEFQLALRLSAEAAVTGKPTSTKVFSDEDLAAALKVWNGPSVSPLRSHFFSPPFFFFFRSCCSCHTCLLFSLVLAFAAYACIV
jgi:hypothetical protein